MNVRKLMMALSLGLLVGCSFPLSDTTVADRKQKCEQWSGYKLQTWIETEGVYTGYVKRTKCVQVEEKKEE